MPGSKPKRRKHPLSTGRLINSFRRIHRITAVYLVGIILLVSVTGILLAWKKNSGGLIQSVNHRGISSDFETWLSIDSLHERSCMLYDSLFPGRSTKAERIDIRKEHGMVKFIFKEGFIALQLDGTTGNLLHVEKRGADLIEMIHDGSILDHLAGTNGGFKLVFSTLSGLALLIFTITGFWLFYGPRRLKKLKRERAEKLKLRRQKKLEEEVKLP